MFAGPHLTLKNLPTRHEDIMHKSSDHNGEVPASLFQTNNNKNAITLTRSKRLQRLGISKIYLNHDGNCKGASRYFLEQFAIANQNIELRNKLKDQLIYSLKLDKKTIIDQEVAEKIRKYQNDHEWNPESLSYIQPLHNKVSQLPMLIMDMVNLMKLNNLEYLYSETCTYEHVTAIITSQNNNYITLFYYDPSHGIYSKVILTNDDLNISNLANIVKDMTYYVDAQQLYVYAKCYSQTNAVITEYKLSLELSTLPDNLEDQQKYLMLAIGVNDYKLTQNILTLAHLSLRFICSNMTPLSLATANRNHDIIRLILGREQNIINFLDRKGYSALGIAVFKKDLDTIKLLLELGASLDYPIGFCNPLKIAQAEGNHEMYRFLKEYSQEPECIIL